MKPGFLEAIPNRAKEESTTSGVRLLEEQSRARPYRRDLPKEARTRMFSAAVYNFSKKALHAGYPPIRKKSQRQY